MKKFIRCIIALIILIVLYPVFSIFLNPFIGMKPPPSANVGKRSCDSNIRVLSGAVEMYNMDNPVMIKYLSDEVIQDLEEKKYINKWPYNKHRFWDKCKFKCTDDLTGNGIIYCEFHGSVGWEGEVKPSKECFNELDRQARKLWWEENRLIIIVYGIIMTLVLIL